MPFQKFTGVLARGQGIDAAIVVKDWKTALELLKAEEQDFIIKRRERTNQLQLISMKRNMGKEGIAAVRKEIVECNRLLGMIGRAIRGNDGLHVKINRRRHNRGKGPHGPRDPRRRH